MTRLECFVCRVHTRGANRREVYFLQTRWPQPLSERFSLCVKCAPYWWIARPIAEIGAESGPGGACFFCPTEDTRWLLYDDHGIRTGHSGEPACGLQVYVCERCVTSRLYDVAQAARAARIADDPEGTKHLQERQYGEK